MKIIKKLVCGVVFAAVALGAASAWAYDYNDIPAAYEPVKMLISSGAQYINTGYTPGTTTSIQMEFDTGTYAHDTAFFGTAWSQYRWLFMQGNKGGGGTYRFFGNDNNTDILCVDNKDASLTIGGGSLTLEVDGASSTKSVTLTNSGGTLYIFSAGTSNYSSFGLKSFEISQGGSVVHYYLPAVRRSDSKPGLYDCVTGVFFVNLGTGADFTYEPLATSRMTVTLSTGAVEFNPADQTLPSVTVTDTASGALLSEGTDYTVSYSNTTWAGIAWAYATGAGTYAGEVAKASFQITSDIVLPRGYQKLASIAATGNQYITTGIHPGTTTTVEMDFNTGPYQGDTTFFGQKWNSNQYLFIKQNNAYRFYGAPTTVGSLKNNTDCHLTINDSDQLILDYGSTAVTTTVSRSSSSEVFNIFADCVGSHKGSWTLYSLQIRKGGVLECDFVPARREEDGAVGLYDRVYDVFYANVGTGSFVAGERVDQILQVAPIASEDYVAGEPACPEPVVTSLLTGGTLIKNTDYEVSYTNNAAPGIATAIVTGKAGSLYEGATSEVEFVVYQTMYVNPSATSAEPYTTRETGAATLADAIACANASNWAAKIVMVADSYTGSGYSLATPIMVVGETGDPKDVVLTDSVNGSRAFTIGNKYAGVCNLTITGTGWRTSYSNGTISYGGHIKMSAGKVDNCVISGGYAAGNHTGGWGRGFGGNVYMSGGSLTRSKISEGHGAGYMSNSTDNNHTGRGSGVCAEGDAVVDSCLIYANGNESRTLGGGICLGENAIAANCTIVDNTTGTGTAGSGIYIASFSAEAVNCVVYGNGGTETSELGGVNLGRFSHCASSITNASCATWYLIDETAFVGYPVQDFRLTPSSPLTDHGTVSAPYDGSVATDCFGNPRKSGLAYDIGYYEINQSQVTCSALPASYGYFAGSNLTFTVSAIGGSGSYLYRLDFGNGTTVDTANTQYAYAYPAAGLYTARVSASDDGGNTWSAWADVPTQIAIVPAVMYVDSANASPVYPYDTPAKAAKKIADCLVAMTNNASANLGAVDGGTIRVLAGTHAETGLQLACGVTVCGDTGNPADVVINDSVNGSRAFTMSHAGAVVRDLTVSGTGVRTSIWSGTPSYGGHIYITAGTVENCIVTGGYAAGGSNGGWGRGFGGNVYMSGGRLLRSKITQGHGAAFKTGTADDGHTSRGAGVCAEGDAVVDSCLIYANGNDTRTNGGGIYLAGNAVAANCTIVDNTTDTAIAAGSGLYLGSSTAKAVNCVIYGNGGTVTTEFGGLNLDRFAHCASSVTNESCATWYLIGDGDFAGYSVQDFHANPSSVLVNHGTTDGEWYPDGAGTLDFDGNPRVSGNYIDIGCFEIDQSHVSCSGIQSTYAYFVGSNITFTASAIGGSGSFIFRWDFGNGVTVTASNTDYSYAYPAAGLYTVRVAASDDGGASWCDWTEVSTKTVVVPAVMYVDSANASPVYPYDTPAKAATRIADCLLAMTNNSSANLGCVDGGTIRVLAGTHSETGLQLACGVTVCGDTGDPADVVINDSVNESRAFMISHADAVVRDLTVSGTGYKTSYYAGTASYGGHIYITAGTVENCIVTGGYAAGGSNGGWGRGFGGNVYMSGGRLLRSKITQGHGAAFKTGTADDGHTSRGAGVCAEGDAVVDSCLIYANGSDTRTLGGGICLGGNAVAVNCTIVDNTTGTGVAGSGLYMASSNAKAVNCVMYGNGGTAASEFGGANLDRFAYGASSVTNESCATWKVIDETAFRDWSRRAEDETFLRPRNGGALVDTGSTWAEYTACGGTATEDMRGYERLSGHRLDLGCYASRPRGSVYYIR